MKTNITAKIKAMRELLENATPDCSCGLPTCLGCKADWDVSVETRNSLPDFLDFMDEAIEMSEHYAKVKYRAFKAKQFRKKWRLTDTEGK